MSVTKSTRLAALLLVGFVAHQLVGAQTYTVLYQFKNPSVHGAHPNANLILDSAGNLYGTATDGGASRLGVVFKLDPSGNQTVLHTFTGGTDGAHPVAALIQDAMGNFYGTTKTGGSSNLGIVFKLDPMGNETVLHTFTGGSDGANPYSTLVRDSIGDLYGTTFFGGNAEQGTIFKIDPAGNETILHSFTGGTSGIDGGNPAAGLVRDSEGDFYGTTKFGGLRAGTVFKMDQSGGVHVLLSFPYHIILYGIQPLASLFFDNSGTLYGTTSKYGSVAGDNGTVFKIGVDGSNPAEIHGFSGSDGATLLGNVIRDSSGNLYGTAAKSPGCTCGVVFMLDTNGVETVLHTFTGGTDGRKPTAGLVTDGSGNFYGTTVFGGGSNDAGTIYKITLGKFGDRGNSGTGGSTPRD
jgi:uncharacterized repeat protein (TIGR03803 family)